VPNGSRLLLAVHSAKLAGAQLVALHQAEALARDHELVIAVGKGPLRSQFERLGPVVRGPTRVPIWGASRRRWALELARAVPDAVRLAAIARHRRVDAVVANSTVLVAPVVAAHLARVPCMVHVQESPDSAAARRLFRFHGALADTVVAISDSTARAFRAPRARVVLNRVGIPLPPPPLRPMRRDPGAPFQVLVVGTIDRHKRQDLAVSAVGMLRADGIDAILKLAGPQPDPVYRQEVEALARRLGVADRIDLAGPSTDVPGLLRAAEALLVPAGEVTPLVIMEAMAYGTPVVAAAMGGISEIVVDGESGLLVPPGDAAATAAALRRIAHEPRLAERLASGGRRRVETHFDQTDSIDRLRAELVRLVAKRRPRESRTLLARRSSPDPQRRRASVQ
jgi:glycosyltransferase involved in cell wall biosynthesis